METNLSLFFSLSLGNERWEFGEGRHQYPFSFVLPIGIPSSFEGAHGHVRYTIRAVFQRPRKWNYEYKIPFTVNSIMDLNAIPESTVRLTFILLQLLLKFQFPVHIIINPYYHFFITFFITF